MIGVGSRVYVSGEGVGIIEEIEPGEPLTYGVRWLTPDNVPSWLTTYGIPAANVHEALDGVMPQPRSAEWREESSAFCSAVASLALSMKEPEP